MGDIGVCVCVCEMGVEGGGVLPGKVSGGSSTIPTKKQRKQFEARPDGGPRTKSKSSNLPKVQYFSYCEAVQGKSNFFFFFFGPHK